MAISAEFVEKLAADIGSKVYIDIAKWHLYLSDAHLHAPLAEKLAGLLQENDLSESSVKSILSSVQVTVGGGQGQLPLSDLVPGQCYPDLMEILEEYQRDL